MLHAQQLALIERLAFAAFSALMGACILLLGAATSDDSSAYSSGVVLVTAGAAGVGIVMGIVAALRASRSNAHLALQDDGLKWVGVNGKTHYIANASIPSSSFVLLRNGILDIRSKTPEPTGRSHQRVLLLDYGPNLATVAAALDGYLAENGTKIERVNRFK